MSQKTIRFESKINDEDKWRLIEKAAILQKTPNKDIAGKLDNNKLLNKIEANTTTTNLTYDGREEEASEDSEQDYILEGILFSITSVCLFIVMDFLVHRQLDEEKKGNQMVQAIMFLAATICGCYFLKTTLVAKSPTLGIMRRAPGVITALVYCIVQLNLINSIISLVICALYFLFENTKLRF
ncbi:hypothetical protein BX616_002903 [Lobosporangium transversale]|nr:hypothetical protein BX616_002903 [Lobosporangium transversale]